MCKYHFCSNEYRLGAKSGAYHAISNFDHNFFFSADIYNHDENPVDQVDDNTLGLEVRSGFPGSSSLAAESKSGGEMKSDTSKSSARKLFNCDNRSIILGCVALIFLVRIRTS